MSDVDAKDRELEIARAARDKKVGKMFFDERQRLLFPFANQITQPMTNEILSLKDPTGDTSENVKGIFLGNLTKLLAGDGKAAKNIMDKLTAANFNEISLSFINASWADEVKAQLMAKFKSGNTNENAIVMYFKKYVQTYDSNNDGVRDAIQNLSKPKPLTVEWYQQEIRKLVDENQISNEDLYTMSKANLKLNLDAFKARQKSSSSGAAQSSSSRARSPKKRKAKNVGNTPNPTSPPPTGRTVVFDNTPARSDLNEQFNMGKGFRNKKRFNYTGRGLVANDSINPKLFVDMTHLNNNRLAIKYKSTKKLCEKPKDITDAQRDSVLSILHNEYTEKQYNKLRSEEKELIHDFAIQTQAKDVDFITQKNKLRMKFDVLIGEIEAGNDSEQIRAMLKATTTALMKNKGVSRMEGLSLLSQL